MTLLCTLTEKAVISFSVTNKRLISELFPRPHYSVSLAAVNASAGCFWVNFFILVGDIRVRGASAISVLTWKEKLLRFSGAAWFVKFEEKSVYWCTRCDGWYVRARRVRYSFSFHEQAVLSDDDEVTSYFEKLMEIIWKKFQRNCTSLTLVRLPIV